MKKSQYLSLIWFAVHKNSQKLLANPLIYSHQQVS